MNRNHIRSLFSLIIWGTVTIIFIPLFFTGGGVTEWVLDRERFIASGAIVVAAYILFFIMLAITGRKRANLIERDERDILISRRSSEITLTIMQGYVFLTCIVLYFMYRDSNSVPAGWLWFLGYTGIFVGYISYSAVNLILYGSKDVI